MVVYLASVVSGLVVRKRSGDIKTVFNTLGYRLLAYAQREVIDLTNTYFMYIKDITEWRCVWCSLGVSENTNMSSMYIREFEIYPNICVASIKNSPLVGRNESGIIPD